MDNVGYILASRSIALQSQQNRIADQVANGNTVAFKLERDVMEEVKLDGGNAGKLAFTEIGTVTRDNSNGPYQKTDRPLDLAIQGDAYFMVETPLGPRYTRAGNFTVNVEGDLVNKDGYRVLGAGGQITNFAPEDTDISIKEDGLVTVGNGEGRGQVGLYKFENPMMLERVGANMYRSEIIPDIAEDSVISQGMLEQSNVNMVTQMTELINVSRGIEMAKKTADRNHEIELDSIRRIARNQ